MRLFIAEKPSVAKAIATELGIEKRGEGYFQCKNNVVVTNCYGHILELQEPDYYLGPDVPLTKKGKKIWRLEDLPIIPQKWVKKPKADAKKQLRIIGDLLKKASDVVNAGDPDHEGQLLVDEVIEHHKYRGPVLRYWQSAMDPTSVRRALAKLESNKKYETWGTAAQCRSCADWLIGMNLTRCLSIIHQSTISAGRVQSTTLRLIVDRDLAIKNFKSKKYFTVEGTFKSNAGSYRGIWQIPDELKDPDGYLTDQQKLKATLAAMKAQPQGEIISYSQQIRNEAPKLLYTLTDLQVECSRRFGYSANKTLETAQKLYEEYKLTSYPRTSCPHLPCTQKTDVGQILNHLKETFPQWSEILKSAKADRPSKIWNDKKVAEEAHTGLTPTLQKITAQEFAKLPEDCRKVYELIARRYAASFLPDHSYFETQIETVLAGGELFKTTGKKEISPGWKVLYAGEDDKKKNSNSEDEDEEIMQDLPILQKGIAVSLSGTEIKTRNTKPPRPFTEGTLVKAMEEIARYIDDPGEKKLLKETSGIGTAATRAAIIERLKNVGYIRVIKGKIQSTEFGQQAVKLIPQRLQSASLTARAEDELKLIQNREGNPDLYQKEIVKLVRELLKEASMTESENPNIAECPKCKGRVYRNESKFRKDEHYWRCSECGQIFQDDNGKIGPARVTEKCPCCGKPVYRYESKYKKGEFYWYCSSCKQTFTDNNGKIGDKQEKKEKKFEETKCPNCGKTARRFANKSDPDKYHWYCFDCQSSFADDSGKIGEKLGGTEKKE